MKRYIILLSAVVFCAMAQAQYKSLPKKMKHAAGLLIEYTSEAQGHQMPGVTLLEASQQTERISRKAETKETETEQFPKETSYVDFAQRQSLQVAQLKSGEVVSSVTPFEYGKGLQVTGDTTFLGLKCKIAKTSINSNWIEIWYTEELGINATPQPGVGVPEGTVLRISRNSNYIQSASKLTPMTKAVNLLPENRGRQMEASVYRYTLNHSNVVSVPVFVNESVHFTGDKAPQEFKEGEIYHVGGGTIILRKVHFPDPKGCDVFAEVSQFSKGDAYDRTGSIFLVPTDKKLSFLDAVKNLKAMPGFKAANGITYPALVSTEDYTVPTELTRFFTAFGVRQFNHNKVPGQNWVDSVLYKTDVTNLSALLKGDVWVGAYIGNWDKNGHNLSLRFNYYPEGEREFSHVLPLFNTVNYLEQAGQEYPTFLGNDTLRVKFSLKENARNARLYYLTTGHGGWEHGDEFNPKLNTIYLDGQKMISFVPWRDDCGTYRNLNPCSGNFSNGESSSDLSRSNWCPGTVTNPDYIWLGDIPAGTHELKVQIPQGAPEGGSISYWCISGSLLYQ
jgi:hypothetical protein